MMPNPHVYGHHQLYPHTDASWMQASQQQQQQQQHQVAASTAVQQQHYGRLAGSHGAMGGLAGPHGHEGGHETMISEENRRTMAYITDLLNENTREAALLELSKKREAVPEMALLLWNSFGWSTLPH
jgi:CCR4-NOT transcription complex subunit 9